MIVAAQKLGSRKAQANPQPSTGKRLADRPAYTQPPMDAWIQPLIELLALPQFGLSTVFVVSFISATLLPMGSEPVVFGLVKLNPSLFWPAVLVATVGNTLGGAVDWWLGYGAHKAADKYRHSEQHGRALRWLEKLGPKACLLAWLPAVGDPLCAVAGWLKFPFWPCLAYMAVGKFLRYFLLTGSLVWAFPGSIGA
jgi:membrane protein YqaA with SNARE-associated domain